MISEKKTFFFVVSFWVEIVRLPHSFGLWGCLGHSKRRQFDENPMDLTRIPMDLGRILFIKSYQIHRISMKLTAFRVSQAPSHPKTMRQTKYLDPKTAHEKNDDFCKNHFFAEIFTFFETSKSKNSRSGRSSQTSSFKHDRPGSVISPNWSDL